MESNIGFTLIRNSRKQKDKIAVVFGERRLSYRDLNKRVNRLAHALLAHGVKAGTKIAVILNNCNELVESIYATFKIAGVVVPINTRLTAQEIFHLIEHSDSSTLIFDSSFLGKVRSVRDKSQQIERYIMVGDQTCSGFLHYDSLLLNASAAEPEGICVEETDEACILYTAGTTGEPKGVVLTHRNFLWLAANYCMGGMTSSEDISMYIFPLFHVGGMATFISHIFIGGTALLKTRYDPLDCLETIHRERINRWSAIPTIYSEIVDLPNLHRFNLDSITKLSSGAAPMPMKVKGKLAEIFPNAGILDGYGQTESAGAITQLYPKDAFLKPGSVGLPYPTNEIRVVDDNNEDVQAGEVGELVYDGYTRMKCYYKNPEATQEAMRGGWMHSGDLVTLDDEGYIYLIDRKKDMIVTGGENVYSREVEDTIRKCPHVAEAAVIATPDPKWGEAVTAVIVLGKGAQLSKSDIISFCKNHIASYKSPKKVIFTESLPKNSVGKILKRELKRLFSTSERTRN